MAHNFLAFDLGAESGRAILGTLDGGRLSLAEKHRFANPTGRLNGHWHWDLLVGDGELRPALEAEARIGGAEGRVRFAGLVPRNRVFETLAAADAFVSTSHVEGLPVATLEAMACGLPVVLSDIPAHHEIAAGTDFIPLVPVDDVAGFAREIARLRGLPADRLEEIGRRCRSLVEERFALSRMHEGYAAVYAEVAAEPAARPQ